MLLQHRWLLLKQTKQFIIFFNILWGELKLPTHIKMEKQEEDKRSNWTWKILLIVGMIILLAYLASAIYAGESMSFETNLTNPVYTVTGNSSNLTGLNISFENSNITISIPINYKPDNFTLIFFDNTTREIEKIINTGGNSGSGRGYIDREVIAYVPEYINNTIEIEKEVKTPVDNTTVLETGFELWHILLAIIVGGLFAWFIIKSDFGKKE